MKVFDCIVAINESGRYNGCCENVPISIVANSFSEVEEVFNLNKENIIKDLSERFKYTPYPTPKYTLVDIKIHDNKIYMHDSITKYTKNAN